MGFFEHCGYPVGRIGLCSMCSDCAYLTAPSILPSSTEGEDDRRVVVLAYRADLPVGEKTSPWCIRIDRLPEPPQDPQLLLITEHSLAS